MGYKNDNGYRSDKRYPRLGWSGVFSVLFVIAIVVGIVGGTIYAISWGNTTGTSAACTVKDKTASSKSKGGTDYRIYTDNCGVLAVADDVFKGKWDSADRYSSIEVGKTYDFDTVGWRAPILSGFPNILTAREVK